MLEELERLPPDRKFFFINLFNVPANASLEQLWFAFEDFKVDDIIPNKTLPNLWDLKLDSRDTFKAIVSRARHLVAGKQVFLRFSGLKRQPQPPHRRRTPRHPSRRGGRQAESPAAPSPDCSPGQSALFQLKEGRGTGFDYRRGESGVQADGRDPAGQHPAPARPSRKPGADCRSRPSPQGPKAIKHRRPARRGVDKQI